MLSGLSPLGLKYNKETCNRKLVLQTGGVGFERRLYKAVSNRSNERHYQVAIWEIQDTVGFFLSKSEILGLCSFYSDHCFYFFLKSRGCDPPASSRDDEQVRGLVTSLHSHHSTPHNRILFFIFMLSSAPTDTDSRDIT